MLIKALIFSFIVFGITFVVAFFVAAVIKAIAVVVQRERKGSPEKGAK